MKSVNANNYMHISFKKKVTTLKDFANVCMLCLHMYMLTYVRVCVYREWKKKPIASHKYFNQFMSILPIRNFVTSSVAFFLRLDISCVYVCVGVFECVSLSTVWVSFCPFVCRSVNKFWPFLHGNIYYFSHFHFRCHFTIERRKLQVTCSDNPVTNVECDNCK